MAIEAHLYPSNTVFPFRGSQGLMINNIESCFNPQLQHVYGFKYQQPGQNLQNERQMNQDMSVADPSLLFLSNSNSNAHNVPNKYNHNVQPLAPNSQSLAVEFEEQRDEVDRYIRSQNEKLKILLHKQRKQLVAELLKKVESDAIYVLSQKDEQIAQAVKKRAELEEFLRRLEAENQSWRRVAQEKEAMVLSLHNTLEQIKERASTGVAREDAESYCDESKRNMAMEEEAGENRLCCGEIREPEQITKKTMICKHCNSRSACSMFLPCRHLCSCKTCEAFLQACPLCKMPKKSSIETLIS